MAKKSNRQKIKLLKLLELLSQRSDEEHPLTTSQLIQALGNEGISCDRRTLKNDIDMLNECGYEVMEDRLKHEKAYYVVDRKFSVSELKILIDAIQAASFITPNKTAELIDKIANLGGSHRAEILKTNMVCFNTTKHTNESIYYNVFELESALRERKKVSFQYFDHDEHGKRVYRKNGERYLADPMALVFNDDNYYLMCYSDKYKGINNYRVDRMEKVNIADEDVSPEAIMRDDVASYTEQVFSMYGGQKENVILEFDRHLINIIEDKFGEDTRIMSCGEDRCLADLQMQISPTFWGWIFQFVGEMRIVSPKSLANEYKVRAQRVINEV